MRTLKGNFKNAEVEIFPLNANTVLRFSQYLSNFILMLLFL